MSIKQMARSVGLTTKQFRVYAHWFDGYTQEEIRRKLKMRQQSRVSECISRALERRPSLPRRVRLDTRHRSRVTSEFLPSK